jgi:hypothetical protein
MFADQERRHLALRRRSYEAKTAGARPWADRLAGIGKTGAEVVPMQGRRARRPEVRQTSVPLSGEADAAVPLVKAVSTSTVMFGCAIGIHTVCVTDAIPRPSRGVPRKKLSPVNTGSITIDCNKQASAVSKDALCGHQTSRLWSKVICVITIVISVI